MIYNDVYIEMNKILRAPVAVDIDGKTDSFNRGQRMVLQRMQKLNSIPGVLLSIGNSIATTISTNYISLPSDFAELKMISRKVSTGVYQRFYSREMIPFDSLVNNASNNFYNTALTGTPTSLSFVDDDKVYFDKYFAATGTDYIKLDYWKYAEDAVAYDQISITGASGDFTVGETITGGTSGATATVYALDDDDAYVQVTSSSVSGTFQSGEIITGGTSSVTATTSSLLSPKVQVMDIGAKYQTILAVAGAMKYLFDDGSDEAQEKDMVLDGLIQEIASLNKSGFRRLR